MSNIYRIRLKKHTHGTETYYEPTRLTQSERVTLHRAGWAIRESRVDAAREHARLTGLSAYYGRADANLRGASSACHGYAFGAAVVAELAADVIAAGQGRGSLREAVS